ncbi:MAG: tyrosine-type recombinase/integrase [Thermoleophilaceae bacterium]|nr:tyrosine-type recombinase/integrase [Thermoleophilaceae bacterium]
MVVLQAMFKQAIRWRWIESNPVKAVEKPSARRQRAVVCLAPAQVEAIRAWLIGREKLYAATIVSLVAYQGLRIPEEVLALEVRHVRANTLLIEQRNIKGRIVAGQKVRHFRPRSPKLLDPVRRDVTQYLMATGIREGLLFPRQDGEPWKVHDYKNWTRRVWKKAREAAGIDAMPPYDLRHAYASLRIRAGVSIPELAEELGHSPPDDRGHLHARDPRAPRGACGLRRGADRACAKRRATRPRGDRLNILPRFRWSKRTASHLGRYPRASANSCGRAVPNATACVRGVPDSVGVAVANGAEPRFATGMARPGIEPGTPRFSGSRDYGVEAPETA